MSRKPTRYFGTPLGFTAQGNGLWRLEWRGYTFDLEKRRGEPGAPGGWYYFGPGAPDGVLCGDLPQDAAERAFAESLKIPA